MVLVVSSSNITTGYGAKLTKEAPIEPVEEEEEKLDPRRAEEPEPKKKEVYLDEGVLRKILEYMKPTKKERERRERVMMEMEDFDIDRVKALRERSLRRQLEKMGIPLDEIEEILWKEGYR